ncbi:uncharacterized protein BT62DRAFT_1004830 [Guyanagaster necrorhizus]|uniref:Uncharacterized protein n=1 Tax=Guyanagaster necrorhizus TaxID=856835 RepID=A0A9P8ATC1_9AGAR|nr:uncharacterized protein BT62DRAFT_1004830 [Guyanagaster necrorhizus MCA 3950]KAG7447259.1 hypothetical protein BT62DRAFT_1004830 [Guyanagaster necrorhizus MCA 3950]
MWLHFNDDLQIDAYDFMPRKLDKFLDTVALMLSDQISLEMPLNVKDNIASIISQKVSEDVCTAALEDCTGTNQQYDSKSACVKSVSSSETDTDICRYMFKNMVQSEPDAHCASLGPDGGDCDVFELTYRKQMRRPLLIHHFSALFSTIFLQVMLQMSMHIEIVCVGLLWLFQVTTEQSISIRLLLYLLKYPRHVVEPTLKFATQSIYKTVFLVWLLVWWGLKLAKYHKDFDIALSVMLMLTCTVLMATQVQGPYAVWAIAQNISRSCQRLAIKKSAIDIDNVFLLRDDTST